MGIQSLGIDVSVYQGDVDWPKVAATDVEFAILRAGYGKSVGQEDKYFKSNYSGTATIGLPTGAYWYSYANSVATAELEAETCLQVLDGRSFIYPVFIDIEETESGLSKAEYTNMAGAFCDKIAAAGYKAGVYANEYFLTNYIDSAQLGDYYIWLAHYTTETDYAERFDIHQFSNTGNINGVSGNVDLNRCYTDFAGSSGPSEAPESNEGLASGSKITLKNAALYISSTATKRSASISGIYYVYDGIVSNGRIRITNASNNVGKTPMGTYVTGWVSVSEISSENTAGTKLSLNNVNLYVSSSAKTPTTRVSGAFYLYDGITVNDRMRITNSSGNVEKTPMSTYVTGWINKSDI